MLLKISESLGLDCELRDIQGRFGEIIQKAHDKCGQPVVVFVDEYDKPILDNIDHPEVAAESGRVSRIFTLCSRNRMPTCSLSS